MLSEVDSQSLCLQCRSTADPRDTEVGTLLQVVGYGFAQARPLVLGQVQALECPNHGEDADSKRLQQLTAGCAASRFEAHRARLWMGGANPSIISGGTLRRSLHAVVNQPLPMLNPDHLLG
jgi:hypothetical protein